MRPVDGRDAVQAEAGDGSVFVTPGAGGYGEPA
jgi:N-methylhydantoinase B/oxoprolinase/acetone carboxylase alpha subunit